MRVQAGGALLHTASAVTHEHQRGHADAVMGRGASSYVNKAWAESSGSG